MKIYTKSGDQGWTQVNSQNKLLKSHLQVETLGSFDELGAVLASFRSSIHQETGNVLSSTVGDPDEQWQQISLRLEQVQNLLFDLGALVADPKFIDIGRDLLPERAADIERFTLLLETEIDAWQAQLPPLKNFILAGGSETATRGHLARTVCRRAERNLVRWLLDSGEPSAPSHAPSPTASATICYMNRLSDWLFTAARLANYLVGHADCIWEKQLDQNSN